MTALSTWCIMQQTTSLTIGPTARRPMTRICLTLAISMMMVMTTSAPMMTTTMTTLLRTTMTVAKKRKMMTTSLSNRRPGARARGRSTRRQLHDPRPRPFPTATQKRTAMTHGRPTWVFVRRRRLRRRPWHDAAANLLPLLSSSVVVFCQGFSLHVKDGRQKKWKNSKGRRQYKKNGAVNDCAIGRKKSAVFAVKKKVLPVGKRNDKP